MNQKGMTLVEIVVSMGLVVGVSLVGLNLAQNTNNSSKDFERSTELLSIERNITSYLLSNQGCKQLITGTNITPGESFNIKRAQSVFNRETGIETTYGGSLEKILFETGQEINDIKISEMVIDEVSSLKSSADSDSGILTLKIVFQIKKPGETFNTNSRQVIRRILVPVGLEGQKVVSCQLNKLSSIDTIKNSVCSDLFGTGVTASMSCAEAVNFVLLDVKRQICLDITGKPLDASGSCPFKLNHSLKSCSAGHMAGFNGAGNPICN